MIIKSLLNISNLAIRSRLNASNLVSKIIQSTNVNLNNLNKNAVLSIQSVRFKMWNKRTEAQYNREFRSTWLTRITPDDINDRQAMTMFRNIRQVILSGEAKRRKRRNPIDFRPQMKGIVLKTMIKKPKKPNSANRKCVFLRLSNGKEAAAHVPGVGHNLQEHSMVLVHSRRTKDVPGLRLKCIRGVYDLAHVYKEKK